MELYEGLKTHFSNSIRAWITVKKKKIKDDEDGPGTRAGYKSPQANLNSTLTGRPELEDRRSRVGDTTPPSDQSTLDIKLGGGVAICEV